MPKSDKPPALYQDPGLYEAFFDPGLADLPFYSGVCALGAGTALELGCGGGRLLAPLLAAGFKVEGLDFSPAMLKACAKAARGAVLHQGDWRHIDLKRRYQAVLFPFNGLQHLHSAEDENGFFKSLRAHLEPGGLFALDLHVPQPAILARDPAENFGVEEGPMGPDGELVVAERSAYDPLAQVLTQTWTLGLANGGTRELSLGLRQYFPREITQLLQAQGFEILRHEGGFEGEALTEQSLKQVLLCRMKEGSNP
jgi:SAM-dependent methyltransferase